MVVEVEMKISAQASPRRIADLPNGPAVYALIGGTGGRARVAYVGITDSLKRRAGQHLLTRDSSITTGTSVAGINPDYVTEIRWWVHPRFSKKAAREAAELVAFDVLDPVLRSQRHGGRAAQQLYESNRFKKEMEKFFKKNLTGTGHLHIDSREEVSHRLSDVEDRLERIEERLKKED